MTPITDYERKQRIIRLINLASKRGQLFSVLDRVTSYHQTMDGLDRLYWNCQLIEARAYMDGLASAHWNICKQRAKRPSILSRRYRHAIRRLLSHETYHGMRTARFEPSAVVFHSRSNMARGHRSHLKGGYPYAIRLI
jgi:hypothetical protein